jgi:four helix bundle protein
MNLAVDCYKVTKVYPREEAFGLTSQIRRASVSIAANIAEGFGIETTASFIHFLRVSQGSLKELETHILLSERVGFITEQTMEPVLQEIDRIGRMLRNLIRSLEAKKHGS